MRFRLGLTGSIGMGKSTTAQMFAELGCALWDADKAVHQMYGAGGSAVAPIGALFPDAVTPEGLSRPALRDIIQNDPEALPKIEAIVHPLVRDDRAAFAARHADKICVFDIPLLFETGGEQDMDAVACVTIPAEEQRRRVLARGTMSAEQLDHILTRQMPNADKVARSDYVIVTDTLEHARAQVQDVVEDIERRLSDA